MIMMMFSWYKQYIILLWEEEKPLSSDSADDNDDVNDSDSDDNDGDDNDLLLLPRLPRLLLPVPAARRRLHIGEFTDLAVERGVR